MAVLSLGKAESVRMISRFRNFKSKGELVQIGFWPSNINRIYIIDIWSGKRLISAYQTIGVLGMALTSWHKPNYALSVSPTSRFTSFSPLAEIWPAFKTPQSQSRQGPRWSFSVFSQQRWIICCQKLWPFRAFWPPRGSGKPSSNRPRSRWCCCPWCVFQAEHLFGTPQSRESALNFLRQPD